MVLKKNTLIICTTISNIHQYVELNNIMLLYGFAAFVVNFTISILVFVFTLMFYAHKEKRVLE